MLGVLGDIIKNVSSNPIVQTLANLAGVDIEDIAEKARDLLAPAEEIMDKARTLQQSLTDWLPNGIIPSAQKIIAVSSGGSGIGASMPTATKFMVDDVLFQVVDVETLDNEVEIPQHPTEDRQMIADHTWRVPERLSVRGALIGYPIHTERHKEALEGLRRIKEEGLPVTVITDFPPGKMEDMALRRFSVSRQYPWANQYIVDIEMQHCEYVGKATTEAGLPTVAGRDPGSPMGLSVRPEGNPQQGGIQPSKTGEAPPQDIFAGLLGTIKNGIEKLSNNNLVKMALDWGKDMVRNSIPGAGLVMDALSGNLNAKSLLETAASFIPGGAALMNAALNAIQAGITAVEAVGGLGAIGDVISGKISAETVAKGALGSLIKSATANNPALGAIGRMVQGALAI